MKRIIIFTMGFVLMLATAGFAMHHGGGMKGGGMHHDKWWQHPAVVEMINLSVEEESKVNDMWVQHRRKMIKLKGNLHVEKFELEVLDNNKDFDAVAFGSQYEKMQKASTEIDAERMNYWVGVRSFLGSERFSIIRSHFPMHGKGKMKGSKGMSGMHCCKGMMDKKGGRGMSGMHCCKAMMDMKGGRGMPGMNCCKGMMDMTGGQGMTGIKGGTGDCGKMIGPSQGQNVGSGKTQSGSE